MAKFCKSCGTQIEDDARVCGNCGALVESTPSKVNPSDILKNVNGDSVKKIAEPVKKFLPAIAAVIVLIFVISLFANSGYKGTIKKAFKAVDNADAKALISCVSDMVYEDYDKDEMSELKEELKDELKDNKEDLKESYGKNVKIKYEITDTEKLSDDEFDEFVEELETYYDVSTKKIKAVMSVELEITIKGSEDEDTYDEELTLVKEGGKWKVLNLGQILYMF